MTQCLQYLGVSAAPDGGADAAELEEAGDALRLALRLDAKPGSRARCVGARVDVDSFEASPAECTDVEHRLPPSRCLRAGKAVIVRLGASLTLFEPYGASGNATLFRPLGRVVLGAPGRGVGPWEQTRADGVSGEALDGAARDLAQRALPAIDRLLGALATRGREARSVPPVTAAVANPQGWAALVPGDSRHEPTRSAREETAGRQCLLYLGIAGDPDLDPGVLATVEAASRPSLEPEHFATLSAPAVGARCPLAYRLVVHSRPPRADAAGRSPVALEIVAEAFEPIAALPRDSPIVLALSATATQREALSTAVSLPHLGGAAFRPDVALDQVRSLASRMAPRLAAALESEVPAYRAHGAVQPLDDSRFDALFAGDVDVAVGDTLELIRPGALSPHEHAGYARVVATAADGTRQRIGAVPLTGHAAQGDEVVLLRHTRGLRLTAGLLAELAPAYPFGSATGLFGAGVTLELGRLVSVGGSIGLDWLVLGAVPGATINVFHLGAGPSFATQVGRVRLSVAPRLGVAWYAPDVGATSSLRAYGIDLALSAELEAPHGGAVRLAVQGRAFTNPLGTSGAAAARPELAVLASAGWSFDP